MDSLTNFTLNRTAAAALAAIVGAYLAERGIALLVVPRLQQVRQLPGPPSPSALLGFFAHLEDAELSARLQEWGAAYGDTYAIAGPLGANILVTRDPRALQYATVARADGFGQHWLIANYFRIAVGGGLITAEGAEHRRQRRVLAPAFGDAHVRALVPTFRALAAGVLPKWTELTANGPVEADVYDWSNRYTIDGIGLGGFGHDFHTLNPPAGGVSALAIAFKEFFGNTLGSPMTYAEAAIPMLKALPTTRRRTIARAKVCIDKAIQDMIQERMAFGMNDTADEWDDKGGCKDILSVLIKANTAVDVKPEERLSDAVVADNILLFLAAGHETTANTLAFGLWRLALEPAVQNTLRAELRACPQLAPDVPADECTFRVLEGLPYLDGVVNEMFRLYAAVPLAWRTAHTDHVVPLATPARLRDGRLVDAIPLRKGDMIVFPSYNLRTDVWGEDPTKLKPERWAQLSDVQKTEPGWSHVSTFGYGSKSCIGQRFAALELKVFLATVVREFVLSPSARTADVEIRIKTLLKPYLEGDNSGPQLPLLVTRYNSKL